MTQVPPCDVLCVGAGPEQAPGIEVAIGMGLRVLAVDGNPRAPGLALATCGLHIDLRDAQAVIALARTAGVRAVVPVPLGSILTTSGEVNDALGLRGITANSARLCVDKALMREHLASAGLPQPAYRRASSPDAILAAGDAIGYPVLVKPCDGSGSRGVLILNNREELRRRLDEHLAYARARNRPADSVVEACAPGTEFGVDGVMWDGIFRLLSVRSKKLTDPPYRVALSYAGPVDLEPSVERALCDAMNRACRALELNDCLVHADVTVDGEGTPTIVEMSGRPSGFGLSQTLLPATTGIQPTAEILKALLGLPFHFERTLHRRGLLGMLYPGPGRVTGVADLDRLRSMSGVVELHCTLRVGDTLEEPDCGASVLKAGHIVLTGETVTEVEGLWSQCRGVVQVEPMTDSTRGRGI